MARTGAEAPPAKMGRRASAATPMGSRERASHPTAEMVIEQPPLRGSCRCSFPAPLRRARSAAQTAHNDHPGRVTPAASACPVTTSKVRKSRSQCSSLGECPARRPGHRSTTPARTPTCGAGSRMTGRAWTTSTGCVGRRASAVRCARASRGGSSRTVDGRVVGAVVASRRRPGRSSIGRGRR